MLGSRCIGAPFSRGAHMAPSMGVEEAGKGLGPLTWVASGMVMSLTETQIVGSD